jgi:DNA polymerase III delta prime subunit
MNKDLKKLFNKDYSYPNVTDKDFLKKIYKKREYNINYIEQRDIFNNYEEIQNYRNDICEPDDFKLREQQKILTNFISPNTPYKGLLIMHGTGVGKTCTAISIAEQFKPTVKKYNTKIYVLTFGPNNKETFKNELLVCTGETYLKNKEILNQMVKEEVNIHKKAAINNALQYYKILSYKTFYKKVLGEKIIEKYSDEKTKAKKYKKTDEGDYEREIVTDRITNMNNSVLIVDEAHNLTGNEWGEALKKIIKSSTNLRVVLLTATPMKNLADDIVELLNFIIPEENHLQRDRIFSSDKNYDMKIKENGLQYLREKSKGYVSFFRGNIPYTFARRVDKGIIPKGLLFTPVIKCHMLPFQLKVYTHIVDNIDDALDRSSSTAANFVFPVLDKQNNKIYGMYSLDGISMLTTQLSSDPDKLLELVNKKFFDGKIHKNNHKSIINISSRKSISGLIMKLPYLKHFSIKFFKVLNRLNKLVKNKKGAGTAFVYSNFVTVGTNLFQEVLLQNGYLEFDENEKYNIKDDTIDSYSGITFKEFNNKKNKHSAPFKPATYLLITGQSDDVEDIPEEKQRIVREVFNNVDNIDGSSIKIIIGSKVMNEGVTLENVKEVHIMDVHYNLGKVDQVIGRAIRMCKHQNVITDINKFPEVNVYRYVVSIDNDLSTEEKLYMKAEKKYLLVKKIERTLKEVAIDCPLLLHGNMFPEEIEKYAECVEPTHQNKKKGLLLCPALCDFEKCDIKCRESALNEYWIDNKNTYKTLTNNELDYNTFYHSIAKNEIDDIKDKIKDAYRYNYVYMYDELLNNIKSLYNKKHKDLFKNDLFDQALEYLLPKSENDFNNYKDTIYDKFNNSGYLIQRNKYYIFQPFNQNEDVPMYYRNKIISKFDNKITPVHLFLELYYNYKKYQNMNVSIAKEQDEYDFDSNMEYYYDRKEYEIVGIIDKPSIKASKNENDIFKIRNKRDKILDRKRGTGITTFKGAVCTTAKDKNELNILLKKLPNVSDEEKKEHSTLKRNNMCDVLRNKLLYLEKYSIGKNIMTYVIVPANHKKYPFPFNLIERVNKLRQGINFTVNKNIDYTIDKENNGIFLDERNKKYTKYVITFKNSSHIAPHKKSIEKLDGTLDKDGIWTFIVE